MEPLSRLATQYRPSFKSLGLVLNAWSVPDIFPVVKDAQACCRDHRSLRMGDVDNDARDTDLLLLIRYATCKRQPP